MGFVMGYASKDFVIVASDREPLGFSHDNLFGWVVARNYENLIKSMTDFGKADIKSLVEIKNDLLFSYIFSDGDLCKLIAFFGETGNGDLIVIDDNDFFVFYPKEFNSDLKEDFANKFLDNTDEFVRKSDQDKDEFLLKVKYHILCAFDYVFQKAPSVTKSCHLGVVESNYRYRLKYRHVVYFAGEDNLLYNEHKLATQLLLKKEVDMRFLTKL